MLTSSYLNGSGVTAAAGAAVSNSVYTNCVDDQLLPNNDTALHRQISLSGNTIEYPWMKEKKPSSTNNDIRRQRGRDEYSDLVLLQSTPAGQFSI
jgi:hypothetical protein